MIFGIFDGILDVAKDIFVALLPLEVIFALMQIFYLKLPKRQVRKIAKGFLLTNIGLVLFMQGVKIGFMPIGDSLGIKLGGLSYNWILVPIGFLLGFTAILAEPAVRILNAQVEEVSGGHINKNIMMIFLCIGVGISVALAMVKVLLGISIWYFIIPGYIICLVLSRFVSPNFVAIAFDSGGVATGPMTVTFILALTVGVAKVLDQRNPLMDGFGMVTLVALTPIISILILGVLYARKEKTDAS